MKYNVVRVGLCKGMFFRCYSLLFGIKKFIGGGRDRSEGLEKG